MAKHVEIWGGVTVGKEVYDDNEIKQLVGKKVGPYGAGWVYGERDTIKKCGGLEMKECDIIVEVIDGPLIESITFTFVGRTGLNECLVELAKHVE